MRPKNKKSVLIMIIILISIVIPCALYGTATHFSVMNTSNPNKEFYYNGRLFFYAKDSNTLLGNYTCKNKICDYAYETVDDEEIGINYYNDNKLDKIELINSKYAFLVDTDGVTVKDYYRDSIITLYDVIFDELQMTIKAVKNYTIGINKNLYIIQNVQNKWGVVRIGDEVLVAIPFSYDFIGLTNHLTDNKKIDATKFIVKDSSGYKIIDTKNNALTKSFENVIYDYNDEYVTIKNNNMYYLYNYQGETNIPYGFKHIEYYDNFVGVINTNNEFYIIDPVTGFDKSGRYKVESIDDVKCIVENNNLSISILGENKETVINQNVVVNNEVEDEAE